jgi:hypothetical protein
MHPVAIASGFAALKSLNFFSDASVQHRIVLSLTFSRLFEPVFLSLQPIFSPFYLPCSRFEVGILCYVCGL